VGWESAGSGALPRWADYTSWAGDRKTLVRVNRLITEAARDPGAGTGKPERLSGDLFGCWSRRIDQEHRLVHTVEDGVLVVLEARYQY
jgi:toxin YoeB